MKNADLNKYFVTFFVISVAIGLFIEFMAYGVGAVIFTVYDFLIGGTVMEYAVKNDLY